ncbi:polysaccharide deacetylase family protein [Alkalibacillus aidingensis]|uniref:polysaccharide deacetylase family protein n=1 Tax=Alkalibacillus aidingensis TaxID=2747607 RepID=UPI002948C0E2|nr:polysaccharide deacetylase family protein [Alkalibacillus aidingensis]
MMRYLFVLLLAMMLVLAACSNDEPDTDEESQTGEEVEQSEDQETDEEQDESEETNEEDSQDSEEEQNEDEQTTDKQNEPQESQYELTEHWSLTPIDDAESDVVLLTIDDAPDGNALEMAENLNELDASAIFFVNGIFMEDEESQDIVKQIHDMGFPIGNHTYGHKSLKDLSEEEQYEEIISLNELIEEVTGEKPEYFRAPHGLNTDYARDLIADEGMLLMNWSYGYDFMEGYMEKEELTDIMVNTDLLSSGANLLMHDREWTNEALEDIVEGLRDKGYEMLDPELILNPHKD